MIMHPYQQRAHNAGILLTNGGVRSKTVQNEIHEWLKEPIYGPVKKTKTRATEKGIIVEDESIDFAIKALDLPFVMKNEKQFEDEFFTGTPDIILPNEIIDIKNSETHKTFPLFVKSIMKTDTEPYAKYRNYYCQLQVYMHLTGIRKARLLYTLMNTPTELLKYGEDEYDYTVLDDKYRAKTFEVEYNPDCIMKLQEGVKDVREYINQLLTAA